MGIGITLGGGGGSAGTSVVSKVPDAAARLALTPLNGDIVIQLDTDELYEWDATLAVWLKIGGAGALSTYAGYSQINGEMISVPGIGFTETATQSYGMTIAKTVLPGTTDMQGVNVNTLVDGTTAATNYSAFGVNSQMGTATATVVSQIEPFKMSGQYFSNLTANGATTFGDNSQIIGAAIADFVSFNTNPVIDTVTMNQVNSLKSNMSIGATSATHLNGFSGIASFDQFGPFADLDGYTGLNFTPSFQAGSIVDGYTGFNHNPQIDSIGIGGYRGIILGANIGQNAAATVNNHVDLQINPTYKTGSSLVSYNAIVVGGNFELGSAVTGGVQNIYGNTTLDGQSITGFGNLIFNNSFGSTTATSITFYQEANFNANFNANTTIGDYLGIIVRPNTSVGSSITNNMTLLDLGINSAIPVGGQVTGINVDVTNFSGPVTNQKQTFNGNGGALQNSSPYDTSVLTPAFAFGNNSLGGQLTIAAGFPIAGVFGFGNNLGITIDAQDDMTADLFLGSTSLGYSVNGFVNQVQIAAGKTIDTLNYMFAAGSFPASSTGGTVTNLAMFRAAGLVNGGGTLNIINEIQFHGDAAVDGGAPTNLWGIRIDSTNADNWFAKNLVIDGVTMQPTNASIGFELQGTTKAIRPSVLTTVQRDALTAVSGMIIFNDTTNQIEFYDGTNWVSTATPPGLTQGSVIFVSATGTLTEDNANFFWDDTNNRLGIITATPNTGLDLNSDIALRDANDASAGVITALATAGRSSIRLTGASGLQGIAGGFDGKLLFLKNRTGAEVLVEFDSAGAAAADRIYTGTGKDLKFKNNQGLILQYDATTARWQVIGGSGATNLEIQGTRAAGVSISAATQIVPIADADNIVFIEGNGGPIISTASPAVDTTSMVIGQKLKIIGTDDDNTVTYDSSVNFVLNGSYTLAKDYVLELMFMGSDGVDDAWIEVGRSH